MLPALIVIGIGARPSRTLVLSQVVLSFGIPSHSIPLVMFTSKREIMGGLVNHRVTTIVATIVAALISGLNIFLALPDILLGAHGEPPLAGEAGLAPARVEAPPAMSRQRAGLWGKHGFPCSLEVAERVDRRPVHAHFEVEVRPEAVAGTAHVADHLSLRDGLPVRDTRCWTGAHSPSRCRGRGR